MNRTYQLAASLALSTFGAASFAQTPYSTPMRDVENPDRSVFEVTVSATIPVNQQNTFLSFPTPPGKRVFVDYYGLNCTSGSASDTFPIAQLSGRLNQLGFDPTVPLSPLVRTGTTGFGTNYASSGPIRLFSDPSSATTPAPIQMNIYHSAFSVTVTCLGFIYGHTL